MAIKKVGIVGGGLMGSGIAQTAAQSGYDVVLAEVNQELLEKGMARVHSAWQMLAGKGRITEKQGEEYRATFPAAQHRAGSADRALIIEEPVENSDAKRE